MKTRDRIIKGLISKSLALFAIIIFLPLIIVLYLLVYLTSKGEAIYKQERLGLNGKKFYIYKFRTMVHNADELKETLMKRNEADGPVFKIKRDPRITAVGRFLRKTGFDELPQLFNVIIGDMDIVGPRPPLEREFASYEQWHKERLRVKPGITCTWQISKNRHDILFDDWVRMDMDYIHDWTVKKDIVILFKTVWAIVRLDGH